MPTDLASTVCLPSTSNSGATPSTGTGGSGAKSKPATQPKSGARGGERNLRRVSELKPTKCYQAQAVIVVKEPSTHAETMESLYAREWAMAMEEEMHSHGKSGTWTLVPRTRNVRLLDCRWVFKIKYTADRTLSRFKARLVIRGYKQREGVDLDRKSVV